LFLLYLPDPETVWGDLSESDMVNKRKRPDNETISLLIRQNKKGQNAKRKLPANPSKNGLKPIVAT
jgi:hypothetical protein